jgi:putative nucleotidyltransferase with HDIG domain
MSRASSVTSPLPVQPLIAGAVLRRMSEDGGADLTALVEIDPSLSAAVLQAANMPHLRQMRRVGSVRQAMVVLGTTAVEALAASRTASLVLGPEDVGCPDGFWVRSVTTAACCSVLAKRLGTNVDEAFTAGMLHDLGDLMLYRFDPVLHGVVATKAATGTRSVLEHEMNIMGRNHVDVAASQMESWLLPDRVVGAVRLHHAPAEALGDSLSRVLWAGYRLSAHVPGAANRFPVTDMMPANAVLKVAGLPGEKPERLIAEIDRQITGIVDVAGRA